MAHPAAYPSNAPGGVTKKAIPVVVASGIAVGVFLGLFLTIGGKDGGAAIGSTQLPAATAADKPSEPVAVAANDKATEPAVVPTAPSPPSEATAPAVPATDPAAATGSAAGPGSAAGAGSAAPVTPPVAIDAPPPAPPAPIPPAVAAVKLAKISFSVKPPDASVTIKVDGKALTGTTTEVDVTKGKTAIEVVATADGYQALSKKLTIEGDDTIPLALIKVKTVATKTSTPTSTPKTTKTTKIKTSTKPKKSGTIDI